MFKSCGRCTYHDSLIPQIDLIYASLFGSKRADCETEAIPFFLCLALSNRPRFSCFQKKNYAEGNEGNDTLFQTIVTFAFDFDNDVDFFFVHCRHVDFKTSPCWFQAPRILCWGTRPPSSRLLVQFYYFFFWLTDPKSEDAFDNKRKKKRGWPTLKLICDKLTRTHCSLLVFSSRNYKFICNLPIRQFSPQQTWWRSEVCHVSTPKYVSPIAKTVNKIKKGIFPS